MKKAKFFTYILILFLLGWPAYQIYGMLNQPSHKEDAGKLLYQVSLFQMEMLGSFLHDMDKAQDTGRLDALRQAIYTANFTHEHLVLAYGEEEVAPLRGLSQLMQYVVRLQIGGQRPLKAEEAQTLAEVRHHYAELYEAYRKLMSPRNQIVASQNEKLAKTDKAVADLLRKKLLQ
ncbi:S-adenosylmethionine decarboxylase [Paenibacillus xerothermodurans]|uniref:S-adenosylmethionine decarboxylase n=1 Tax=Paenibacillus xerothermodurans TaxID=1977292 RepID=A0A2W1NLW4_PAEXE|nr:S-adenosylmethionine decarboxylase [Paenibacillus xerothermodurans]PZE19953.1 S-adenosylmethionine decarboxylase [Paenibacillus xerothermodurans]